MSVSADISPADISPADISPVDMSPVEISDEEMLARLAACDLSAAERVHGRLMAAEDASEVAELGRTYQRIARSLRQTLALKARLKREQAQAARDEAAWDQAAKAAPAPSGGVAVARRLREVRAAVLRVIWDEAEGEDAYDYEATLEARIAVESLGDGFCRETLDDHVARLCLSLDLSSQGAEGWRDLPDPPCDRNHDPDEAPDRLSSA